MRPNAQNLHFFTAFARDLQGRSRAIRAFDRAGRRISLRLAIRLCAGGKSGGYFLARNPDTISLGQVIRHFHGVLAPIGCVSVMRYQRCALEPTCVFRRIFKEIRDHAAALLDRATLASVYAAADVSAAPLPRAGSRSAKKRLKK